MKTYFLSIGSNIEPRKNIPACLGLLKKNFKLNSISSIYESEPVGACGNQKFWNLAVEIQTELTAEGLRTALRKIETALGRERDPANKFVPRTIDIDILPQPDYQNLAFMIVPLAEIAPAVKDQETGKSWEELAREIKDSARGLRKIVSSAQRGI